MFLQVPPSSPRPTTSHRLLNGWKRMALLLLMEAKHDASAERRHFCCICNGAKGQRKSLSCTAIVTTLSKGVSKKQLHCPDGPAEHLFLTPVDPFFCSIP